MRKKPAPKIRIKNLPRFITFSFMSLILLVMIIMSLFFLMTKIADTFNAQKQAIQTSSAANAAESSTPKTANSTTTTNIKQESNTTTTSSKSTDPLEAIKSRLRSGDTAGIKVVFLTFDDGPNEHTGEVLDILNEYDAKGTFFTTLHDNDDAKVSYRRIVAEGHTLANHTSSHDYSLYSTPEAFYADVDALDQYQKQITGQTETSHVFRFPGGSTNSNETCVQGIVNRGWNYSDWNVSSGDGCAEPPPSDVIAQTIIAGCRSNDVSVVLSHAELKDNTRAALSTVIETLQAEGYTFLPMEKDYSYPRHLEV